MNELSATDSLTTFLAAWGDVLLSTVAIILSSIAIGWNMYRDLTDRGKLRVSCSLSKMAIPDVGIAPEEYLVWNIVNSGRQPVLLTTIGGRLGNKTAFLLQNHVCQLPKMLRPGEFVLEYQKASDFVKLIDGDLVALTAIDSLNRTYKAPQKQIKRIKREFAAGKMDEHGRESDESENNK